MEEAGERKGQSGLKSPIATLKDFGITKHQSSEWQRLGAMSEDSFNFSLSVRKQCRRPGPSLAPKSQTATLKDLGCRNGSSLKPHPAASHHQLAISALSGAAAHSPHASIDRRTIDHRRNVSGTAVRNRDPPICDFFPKNWKGFYYRSFKGVYS